MAERKLITFLIENKKVWYFDDMWKHGIQIMPLNKTLVKSMLNSRSPNIKAQGLLIVDANSEKNLKEYESCQNEEDLAAMIRKDCKLKGLVEVE